MDEVILFQRVESQYEKSQKKLKAKKAKKYDDDENFDINELPTTLNTHLTVYLRAVKNWHIVQFRVFLALKLAGGLTH